MTVFEVMLKRWHVSATVITLSNSIARNSASVIGYLTEPIEKVINVINRITLDHMRRGCRSPAPSDCKLAVGVRWIFIHPPGNIIKHEHVLNVFHITDSVRRGGF